MAFVNTGDSAHHLSTATETASFPSRKPSRHKGDALLRPFVAVDSETYHDYEDKEGNCSREKVMLFGFSTGEHITGENITSFQILNLIEEVAKEHADENPIYVSYGFRYDVSFILRDLPDRVASRIWAGSNGRKGTWFRDIRFEYRKEKYLRLSGGRRDSRSKRRDWSVTIYEVSSFFNKMRMNDAARKHLSGDSEYEKLAGIVDKGKDARGSFKLADADFVYEYWHAENLILARLCEHLRTNFERATLPIPKEWFGPSAATSVAFTAFGIKEHKRSQRDLPDDFVLACRYAYFGGRFEQFFGGYHRSTVYQYDITSAYPYAMTKLWSWKDATLYYVDGSAFTRGADFPEWANYAVFHVRYSSRQSGARQLLVPHPFPYRNERGAIYFPHYVEGWYWSPEVKANWQTSEMDILGAWIISPATEQKPFSWIEEYFALRCKYKQVGDPAEYVIKITLNSGYGKTAQRVGWNEETGEPPPFHQLDWAGYITSFCRAMVWEAIKTGNVFQVETDGVFSIAPIELPLTGEGPIQPEDLGKWELTTHKEMITVQNGVYWTHDGDKWQPPKFRGVRKGSKGTTPDDAIEYLSRCGISGRDAEPLRSTTTGFRGQGFRESKDDSYMRWLPEPRQVVFGGNGKRIWYGGGNPAQSLVPFHLGIARSDFDYHSQPHPLPWERLEIPDLIRQAEKDRPDYAE